MSIFRRDIDVTIAPYSASFAAFSERWMCQRGNVILFCIHTVLPKDCKDLDWLNVPLDNAGSQKKISKENTVYWKKIKHFFSFRYFIAAISYDNCQIFISDFS